MTKSQAAEIKAREHYQGLRVGHVAGRSLAHDSAPKHVSGEALYVDDLAPLPGTLYLAVAQSTEAHATVVAIESAAAQAMPGVVQVITAADVPGSLDIGPVFPGDALLANGTVQFVGQAVAAVVAEDEDTARRAAATIAIEYQPLPAVLGVEQALELEHYVRPPFTMQRGNALQALGEAPNRLSGELRIGGQDHFYLEGQVSTAVPQEDDDMLVICSTQNPTEMQKLVAEVLAIPMMRVTVETRRMGGGFGGKETQSAQWACLAALAARRTGQPVRMRLARADDMIMTGKRHPFLCRYQVGFDATGRLLGAVIDLIADCGYSPDLSAAIVDRAMFHADNCYFLDNATITGYPCKTNTVSHTAFRGFGGPQGMLAAEQIIEAIARHLAKDPLDVRRQNFYGKRGRNQTHYYQTVEDNIIQELVAELEQSADYRNRRQGIAGFNRESPVLKRGIALTPVKFGISFTAAHLNQGGALLHVYHDGSIHLNHGGTEMGQGLFIKVAQVVANELQVDVEKIQISATRTDKVPNTSPTAASAGTDLNAMAALNAAQEIKRRLSAVAADHFGCDVDTIEFADNHVNAAEHTLTFEALAGLAYLNRVSLSATGYYRTPKIHFDRERARGRPFYYYAYGAACSEVLIDTLTGEHKVLRVDILHDVGRSLNPAIDRGQVEGGFVQGMGWLTSEELRWDATGRLLTTGPATYKIPAVGDTPVDFRVKLSPTSINLEDTVYRSKAVGEPPLMLAISVWSALKDAVASVADYSLDPKLDTPATPERILDAVTALGEQPAVGKTADGA